MIEKGNMLKIVSFVFVIGILCFFMLPVVHAGSDASSVGLAPAYNTSNSSPKTIHPNIDLHITTKYAEKTTANGMILFTAPGQTQTQKLAAQKKALKAAQATNKAQAAKLKALKAAQAKNGSGTTKPKKTGDILKGVAFTTGILGANFIGSSMIGGLLLKGDAAAKAAQPWAAGIGSLGGLAGALFGGGPWGAVGGAAGAVVGGLLGGGISIAAKGTLYTLPRVINTRVISLDLKDANLYDAKFKVLGDTTQSEKFQAGILNDKNFIVKKGAVYYQYTPIVLSKTGKMKTVDQGDLVVSYDSLGQYIYQQYPEYTADAKASKDNPYADALDLGDDSKQSIGWCHVNSDAIADLDKKVSKEFIQNLADDEKQESKDSFILLLKDLLPSKEQIQIPNYNCFGPNGLTGYTGEKAKPKVVYDWTWKGSNNWKQKCSKDLNDGGVYCDSTQFMMDLISRLEEYNNAVDKDVEPEITNTMDLNGENGEKAQKILSFRAHLMLDGYTKDFLSDFKEYANNAFMKFSDTEKNIISQLIPAKIQFSPKSNASMNPNGYKLPYAGYYNVDIVITFANPTNKPTVYTVDNTINSNIDKVTVFFEPINRAYNPVYNMPLDATVGVVNGEIDRVGYGVDYHSEKGSAIWFKIGPKDSMLLSPTLTSQSTPIVHLNMNTIADPDALNGNMRGTVLQIVPKPSTFGVTYDVTRYLSLPALTQLNITKKSRGGAYAFYTLKVNGTPVTGGRSLIYWNLFCNKSGNNFNEECTSFNGASAIDDMYLPDKIGTDATVAPTGQLQGVTYGLEWDKDSILSSMLGKTVHYIGIAYLPGTTKQGTMQIVTASDQAHFKTQTLTPITTELGDIASIYDAMDQNLICMSQEQGQSGVRFWWNPEKVFKSATLKNS